jgi:ligand-binding sensor domain-containing protein
MREINVAMNHTAAAMAVVALGAAVAGAYALGKHQGATATQSTSSAVSPFGKMAGVGNAKTAQANGQPPHPMPAPDAAPSQGKEGTMSEDPNQKFTHFRVGNKNVKAIHAEGSTVWVATSGGVIRYDTDSDKYRLFDAQSGLLSNGVFYVGRIGGRITVGTYGGGMSIYDEKADKWETLNIPDGLGDAFVYDVLQAKNGDIWIATWSGANRVRGGALNDRSKWDLYTVENTGKGLPNDWVYGLAEGKNGDIWLATEGGLAKFAGGRWENWNHARGLGAPYEKVKADIEFKSDPGKASVHHAKQKQEMGLTDVDQAYNPNYIVSLEVDSDGIVWAGTWGGGLGRFDGKTWKNYTTADGLPGNHVFMLQRDAKNALWIGTNKGLARFDNDKFAVMTTRDGLFSDAVFSMATSPDGTMWVGSFGGVAHLRPVGALN